MEAGVDMPVFYIKSLLSLVIIFSASVALFTMLEIFGRTDRRFNPEGLIKIHRLNGLLFGALSLVIAYLCLDFMARTQAELSSRASFHVVLALAVFLLLALKISFIRVYRQYFPHVRILGLLIALLTFGMVGVSGGYYLLVTGFGKDRLVSMAPKPLEETAGSGSSSSIRTDAESIARGKILYETKCSFCHDAYSNEKGVGPGHKGILKSPLLPASRRPANPGNIAEQLRRPYRDMPAFSYLSDDELQSLIAFLNTL